VFTLKFIPIQCQLYYRVTNLFNECGKTLRQYKSRKNNRPYFYPYELTNNFCRANRKSGVANDKLCRGIRQSVMHIREQQTNQLIHEFTYLRLLNHQIQNYVVIKLEKNGTPTFKLESMNRVICRIRFCIKTRSTKNVFQCNVSFRRIYV